MFHATEPTFHSREPCFAPTEPCLALAEPCFARTEPCRAPGEPCRALAEPCRDASRVRFDAKEPCFAYTEPRRDTAELPANTCPVLSNDPLARAITYFPSGADSRPRCATVNNTESIWKNAGFPPTNLQHPQRITLRHALPILLRRKRRQPSLELLNLIRNPREFSLIPLRLLQKFADPIHHRRRHHLRHGSRDFHASRFARTVTLVVSLSFS
jgi:hypothetical protein